jgi:hypothetical protein
LLTEDALAKRVVSKKPEEADLCLSPINK